MRIRNTAIYVPFIMKILASSDPGNKKFKFSRTVKQNPDRHHLDFIFLQDNALSPESLHSNGSAVAVGSSPVVQTFTYTSRPGGAGMPYHLLTGSGGAAAAAATGPPLMAGGQPPAWIPTSGGAYIIQSPTSNTMEMYPMSSPGVWK